MRAGAVSGSMKEIGVLLVMGVALILLLPKIIAMVIRSSAEEAGKLIPKIEIPSISLFGEKTDKQTITEILQRDYNIKYADMPAAVQAEYQENLGKTKAYYELYHAPMTWDVFQGEIGGEIGGYGAGYDGTTTIPRSEVPPGYTGTYYAGKRVV